MTTSASQSLADNVGLIGVGLYLVSYLLLQLQVLASDRYTYAVLNLVAAACVLLSLQSNFNFASALIQLSWIAISILGLTRIYLIRNHTRFSDIEQTFIDAKLAPMPANWARKLLDLAHWRDAEDGETIAQQGLPVPYLSYIGRGKATVFVAGEAVAELGPGALIGELSCLHGGPASATVVVQGSARLMQIEANALRRLCRRIQGLEQHLELSFGRELGGKLLASNRARLTERL